MRIKTLLAAAATLAFISGGIAAAQTPSAASKPAATSEKAAAPAKAKAPRTAKSLECSKQADAKGLHGKERKKFRSQCKKG